MKAIDALCVLEGENGRPIDRADIQRVYLVIELRRRNLLPPLP